MIDLDILLYGDQRLDTARLTIPHRELSRRRFVLAPLADLIPELEVPGYQRSVAELLAELDASVDPVEIVEDHLIHYRETDDPAR